MAQDRLISPNEAREMLRQIYRSDGEIDLKAVVRRAASDPIKLVTEAGKTRPSTSLVVTGVMVLLLIASFIYFSFGAKG